MDKSSFVKRFLGSAELRSKYRAFLIESLDLIWPILIIMLFDFFMSTTNIKVAGFLGKEVQAAMGMANQTYIIFTVVVHAITIGTIAVISRIYGKVEAFKNAPIQENATAGVTVHINDIKLERQKELSNAVYTAVLFAVGCAAFITVLAIVLSPIILGMMDIATEVKENSITLIRIYCLGLFFHLMMIHFNGILRACKMMRYSMIIMVCASVLNIAVTTSLVLWFGVGPKGIAMAMAISWFCAFCAAAPIIYRLMMVERVFIKDVAKRIFNISWPSGIVAFSWQLSSLTLYWIIGHLPENSVEVMAAITAGLRIESLIYMPAFAFSMANAVLVGNLLGDGRKEDAYYMGLVNVFTGVALIIVLTVVVISCSYPIANLLAPKNEAGVVDPTVLREIIIYLHIVMLSEPLMAGNNIFGGALSGAGDTRPLMRYSLFSLWILRIPTAYFFGLVMGVGAVAIWWAMNITYVSQITLSSRRFLSKKWMELG